MGNVAIVTDSNSGISQAEAKELGIYMIPMPFLVDGKLYFEDVDMNKEQFYHFLENDADLSTSQPSPGDVMDLWDKLLKNMMKSCTFRCPADLVHPALPLWDLPGIMMERYR